MRDLPKLHVRIRQCLVNGAPRSNELIEPLRGVPRAELVHDERARAEQSGINCPEGRARPGHRLLASQLRIWGNVSVPINRLISLISKLG